MRGITTYALLIAVMMLAACSLASEYPEAKVTLKIVDESGNAVDGARVGITFQLPKTSGQGIRDVQETGITGQDGAITAAKRAGSQLAYGAEKEGYYRSSGQYSFKSTANDRWEPWNPQLTLVLRQKVNPVAMYARDTHMSGIPLPGGLFLPAVNKPVGFDLIEYDWVSPWGKGKHSDFIFNLTGAFTKEDQFSYQLHLNFENRLDGIQLVKENRRQGSQLKLPRTAPDRGYKDSLVKSISRKPGNPLVDDTDQNNNYIFRIRSEEKDGKLVRAMYGKIQGDIVLDTDDRGRTSILFKYYLNPDYTRNLEFDPGKNLFTGLESFENVGLE